MPESNSFWNWLLSLFRSRRSTPVVAANPPPVVAPPTVTVPPPTTEPERAAIVAELEAAPALPPPPPRPLPRPPALTPLENTPSLPDIDVGILEQVLPQEGPNLGFRAVWNNHPTVETGKPFRAAMLMATRTLGINAPSSWERVYCAVIYCKAMTKPPVGTAGTKATPCGRGKWRIGCGVIQGVLGRWKSAAMCHGGHSEDGLALCVFTIFGVWAIKATTLTCGMARAF